MKSDSRLSSVLHALLHMAQHDGPMTSEHLAQCLQTNSVVVRRMMAGLREAGLVVATKGHNGGWTLGRPLSEATLYDVHVALGSPRLFGFGNRDENPTCLLERAANAALDDARRDAEAALLDRMRQVQLASLTANGHAGPRDGPPLRKGLKMDHHAIVVGGSFAGLSAALQLARARRRILVFDAGLRRNRFAHASHGFLGQDGAAPADIIARARSQLQAYPTVEFVDGMAVDAGAIPNGFELVLADGGRRTTETVVLATGVRDILPDVPGLRERWGRSVFHCPYCHGYELGDGPIAVLAVGPLSMHHALMLPDWGPTSFLLNDAFAPDGDQIEALHRRGVDVVDGAVEAIIDGPDSAVTVTFTSGRPRSFAGIFVAPKIELSSPIASRLGCALEDGPFGSFIRTDATKATSVPGVFACGDAARMAGNVALAVGDGALAGAAAHRLMMFGAH